MRCCRDGLGEGRLRGADVGKLSEGIGEAVLSLFEGRKGVGKGSSIEVRGSCQRGVLSSEYSELDAEGGKFVL